MRQVFYLMIIVVMVTSCGPAYYVDYEKDKDFSEFTSYQFIKDTESGLNELDEKRLIRAIDSTLQNRDFIRTDYNRFYIEFFVRESIANSRNTLGVGIGSGGGNVGIGVSGGIPIGGRVINQELTINFLEATTNWPLVWQVVVDGELKENATPRQKEQYYAKVVEKALRKFPPKK